MKKIYKFIAICIALVACSSMMSAQTWTAPSFNGSVPVSGSQYFIYNVGSNGFLNRGGQWGAHAVVSATPNANASTTVIKWTPANTTGSIWTFQYYNGTNNVANNFLFPTSTTDGSVFTDNITDNTWNVVSTDAINNIYSIQINSSYGGYVANQYFGSSAATEATNKGIANAVRYNRASGDAYTQWKFVSQADYDLYNAKVLLDRYMNYAKLKGSIALTSYIATYNDGVTADINTAATGLLAALGRTDVTSSITNPSFETNSFTGWTNSGSFALQSNTPLGWTKGGTYYTEKYTGSGGNLGAGTITQTLTGLANGLYGMIASGHAVQQAGANPLHTGAFITAGTLSTEVSIGKDYSVEYIPVIDGTLTIGYKLEAPVACNWTGFDNFILYYYGTMAVPSMTATETSFFLSSATTNTKTFNVSGANLAGDISITAPTGITLTGANLVNNGGGSYTIARANANASNAIIATWDGLATLKNVKITIAESEVTTLNIAVTTSNDTGCFIPLYSTLTNIITDPYCGDLSNFGGWGSTSVETSYVYCGAKCIKVSGKCGGSLDYNLTGKIAGNKTYRVKAMVSTNGTGETKIGISGATATTVTNTISTAVGEWLPVDFTFTTQATVTSPNMYLNSCESQTATESYIDNYEMYDITSLATGLNSAGLVHQNVYVQNKNIVTDFNLTTAGKVEFAVYNTQGMLVSKQVGFYNEGNNKVVLNSNLTTGVYVVKTSIDGRFMINKIIF